MKLRSSQIVFDKAIQVLFGLSSRTTGVTLSFQSSMTHTDIMTD